MSQSNKVINLENKWKFYYDKPQKGQATKYNDEVKNLGTFETVQDFWRYWNNLDISKLPINSNLRLFKDGIEPCWEDPANANGGKWVVVRNKDENASRAWLVCVLTLIGEQFTNGDDICGTVLSLRAQGNNISVWNKSSVDKEKLEITEREIGYFLEVPREKIRYQPHRDLLVMNNLSFNIKLSRSVELPSSPPKHSLLLSTAHTQSAAHTKLSPQDQNDFITPYIDLDNPSSMASTTETTPKTHKRSNSVVSARVVHRKSQSYNIPELKESPNTRLLRLTSSIDSDSFRMWHSQSTKNYQLPKRYKRKGKRMDLSDKPLDPIFTVPVPVPVPVPVVVPAEPPTKTRAKSASCVIPSSVHKIRANMDTIPEVPITIKKEIPLLPQKISPVPLSPPLPLSPPKPHSRGFLGIPLFSWFAFLGIIISFLILSTQMISALLHPYDI